MNQGQKERTTIALSKRVLSDLRKVAGQKTNTRAVQWAIEEAMHQKKLEHFLSLAGTFRFKKTARQLRHGDHRTG